MNGIEGFVIGMLVGIVLTFFGIMQFAKWKTNREELIEEGRNKVKKK